MARPNWPNAKRGREGNYRVCCVLTTQVTAPGFVGFELLPDDGEVWLVRGEAQHDQVGVCAAQTVVGVGVVVGLRALAPDEVHDLMLT